MADCLACQLISGERHLPGGRIHTARYWVVEHCVGPLGVGTLIVKPYRHCEHVWELTDGEAHELGPLLQRIAGTIRVLLSPDQVYICLWSHSGWRPGHVHFVLQPAWNKQQDQYDRPGPFLQVDMFDTYPDPDPTEVESFASRARTLLESATHE